MKKEEIRKEREFSKQIGKQMIPFLEKEIKHIKEQRIALKKAGIWDKDASVRRMIEDDLKEANFNLRRVKGV